MQVVFALISSVFFVEFCEFRDRLIKKDGIMIKIQNFDDNRRYKWFRGKDYYF